MEMFDKRLAKGEATHEKIVEAAIKIMSQSGISGVTAAGLAREAKVAKSSIFHHFDSVAQVPLVALDYLFSTLAVGWNLPTGGSLQDYLKAIGEAQFGLIQEDPTAFLCLLTLYHQSLHEEPYRQRMEEHVEEMLLLLEDGLKQCKDVDPAGDTIVLARLILATMDGLGIHCLTVGGIEDYKRSWGLFSKALVVQAFSLSPAGADTESGK